MSPKRLHASCASATALRENRAYNVPYSSLPEVMHELHRLYRRARVRAQAGTSRLSTANLATVMELQQQDLANLAGVHRNTLRTHPESPKFQSTLRDLKRVLSAAVAVQPDFERGLFLVKNQPIPTFRHKTILQLLQDGRTEDAIDYLESISAGFVG